MVKYELKQTIIFEFYQILLNYGLKMVQKSSKSPIKSLKSKQRVWDPYE